jgi:hypothetical protein
MDFSSLLNQVAQQADPAAYAAEQQRMQQQQMTQAQRLQQLQASGAPQEVLDYFRGYNPSPWTMGASAGFDGAAYLSANPDVAADPYFSANPEQHWLQYGQAEGRQGGGATLGGWWTDYNAGKQGVDRFTDSSGYNWMVQPGEDGEPAYGGLRTSMNPGELVGQGQTTNLYFDPTGQYSHDYYDEKGWLNPLTGILAVAGFGLGAQALAAGAGGGGAAAGGTGMTGAGFGDAGMMYAGADAAAAGSLGGGASVAGGSALGGTAAMGAGAAGMGGAELGGSGAFLGEGAASGIPAWDGAAGSGIAGASSPSYWDTITKTLGGSGGTGGSMGSNLLGLGSTALGALGGYQGQDNSASSTRQLPAYLQGPVANDLIPRTQGLLAQQMPSAYGAGSEMMAKGSGLLGQTAPNTATNPFATGILNDMQRRHGEVIDQRLQGISGNAVSVGGLGGSRQGVAQGQAISQGADNFAGQGFNFMGGLYNADQNRLRQDWTIGSGLMNQGLNTQFQPLQNASQIYSPYSGFGTTTNNQNNGGGWMGAAGGALGAAQMGKNLGWW